MSKNPTTRRKVNIPMGQRKSGLTVPAEVVDVCRHVEVLQRIKPQVNQSGCGGCKEKVLLVILQFALMSQEGFENFKKAQAEVGKAAQRRKTGLVLPDEVRREQQEQRKG